MSRIERGCKRQGIVPDFKVPGGPGEGEVLADLKFISCNTTRYSQNPRTRIKRAVERRADALTAEYTRKAKAVDIVYGGVPPSDVGPVQHHLHSYGQVRGYVVGRWREMNESLHNLVHDLASARLRIAELLPGRHVGGNGGKELSRVGILALLTGSIRRRLSLVAVRSQARLLLNRMEGLVGEGAVAAAKRRAYAVDTDRVIVRERCFNSINK